jgi:hypothetical protein
MGKIVPEIMKSDIVNKFPLINGCNGFGILPPAVNACFRQSLTPLKCSSPMMGVNESFKGHLGIGKKLISPFEIAGILKHFGKGFAKSLTQGSADGYSPLTQANIPEQTPSQLQRTETFYTLTPC